MSIIVMSESCNDDRCHNGHDDQDGQDGQDGHDSQGGQIGHVGRRLAFRGCWLGSAIIGDLEQGGSPMEKSIQH